MHIHVPQNLTHRGVKVENYHDIRLDVAPVLPDPRGSRRSPRRSRRHCRTAAGSSSSQASARSAVTRRRLSQRFVERFQTPLLTTLDGKGIIAERHPLAVGVFSESGHSSAWKAFREADVVLAIGNSLNQHATFGLRDDLFDGKTLIQVNISATEIGKTYRPDHALVSDARLAVEAITEALEQRVGEVEPGSVDGQEWEARKIPHLPGKIHPGRLAQMIGRMLPDNAILLADAGRAPRLAGLLRRAREGPELPQDRRVRADVRPYERCDRRETGTPRSHSRGRAAATAATRWPDSS